ncbi:MAG: T9SS type A sorting domain-containing protein [Bacteroidetes bacterium]|nr:T9SS type A sorting domain-containing protein [Bacteroidota bacterium]
MKNIIIAFAFLFALHGLHAQTIYVDITNNTGIEDGTQEHPFNTINEALNIAQNLNTISIAAGTYPEDSLLITRNVHIKGISNSETIIEGLYILSGAVDIMPVTIQDLACKNIVLSDSSILKTSLSILGCKLNTFSNDISIIDSTGCLYLSANTVDDSIHLYVPLCKGIIEIIDCETADHLALYFSSLREGKVSLNGNLVGGDMKISTISKKDTLVVANNDINGNLEISSVASAPDIINDNQIGLNTKLSAVSSSGFQFKNNQIVQGSLSGSFTALDSAEVTGNTLNNGGIYFHCVSTNLVIRQNTIQTDGSRCGIKLQTVAGGTIENNFITLPYIVPSGLPFAEDTNAICGIRIHSVAFRGMRGNKINGGTYGTYLYATASNNFAQNEINNAHYGLYLSSASARIDSNLVELCTGDGMVLDFPEEWDTSAVSLNHNIIRDNGGHGIWVKDAITMGRLNEPGTGYNTVKNNGGYDLYIETPAELIDTIWAQNNEWSHDTESDVGLFDVYDNSDDPSKALVIYSPVLHFGINDIEENEELMLWPNPTLGKLNIKNEELKIDKVELVDLFGKILMVNIPEPATSNLQLDISRISPGIYFLKIITDGQMIVKKVIKS